MDTGRAGGNIFMALSGRRTRTRSHPRSTTLFPNVSQRRAAARTRARTTRGRTHTDAQGHGSAYAAIFSPNICSACTYIRRRLIESKGRGRYKVCRPPRHKTHALLGRTLPNERTSRSCSNVHLVSVDTPTLPSVPKKLEMGERPRSVANRCPKRACVRARVVVGQMVTTIPANLSRPSASKEGFFELFLTLMLLYIEQNLC